MRSWVVYILFIFLISCKTIELIPVVETKVEYIDKIRIDSISQTDSIFLYINGDTVYKYKEKTKYKYVILKDTIVKIDSIPYPVVHYESIYVNKIYWWLKVLMGLGIITTLFIGIKFKNFIKWK